MNIASTITSAVKNWWLLLLLGIVLILLGFWILQYPVAGFLGLSVYFSVALFISGISQVAFAVSNKSSLHGWGWYLVGGLFDLLMGMILMFYPALSMAVLPLVVGFWLMFRGISLIGGSMDLKAIGVPNWGLTLAGGILTSLLAFFIIIDPLSGALTIGVWTGLAALMGGIFNVVLSFKLKNVKNHLHSPL